MIEHPSLLEPEEIVLPTMNADGSRNWLRPRLTKGPYYWKRLAVAWALIIIFVAIPHIRMAGKPLIFLDIMTRQFTFFGVTFLATDVLLLFLFVLGTFLSIFLFTALFGRVWCGWGCPQTVYLEFVFRPIEQWLEGSPKQQRKLDKEGPNGKRILKYFIFLLIAFILGNTFLAYFVGTDRLFAWMQRSPFEHPSAFLVMAGVTGAVYFDFAFFREQTCLVACPYGRFQSALLDKDSLIVAYDVNRGEPRARGKQRKTAKPKNAEDWGDCIQCNACVVTCPTGIDIRDGLQMECINCTQCIDACDAIMDKVKKPRGLIRYTSQNELENKSSSLLRARTILYPSLILAVFAALASIITFRGDTEVSILRSGNAPFSVLEGNIISGRARIRIANRTHKKRVYHIGLKAPKGVRMIAPLNPVKVGDALTKSSTVFVLAPAKLFKKGGLPIQFVITEKGGSFKSIEKHTLLGPDDTSSMGSDKAKNTKDAPQKRAKAKPTPARKMQIRPKPAKSSSKEKGQTQVPKRAQPTPRTKVPKPRVKAPKPSVKAPKVK